jgi:hypothetical protein
LITGKWLDLIEEEEELMFKIITPGQDGYDDDG